MESNDTPQVRMHNSFAMAAAQIRLAADLKRERMENYGQADENTAPFNTDQSTIFPKEGAQLQTGFQNRQLGIGNTLGESSLFFSKGTQVWKAGAGASATPNYMSRPWEELQQSDLCVPFVKVQNFYM